MTDPSSRPAPAPTDDQYSRESWKQVRIAVAVGVVAVVGLILFVVVNKAAPRGAASGPGPSAAAAQEPSAKTWPEPLASDIKLTVKILKKECFGSAGCNVTYTIQAACGTNYEPGRQWDVTYEVKGAEDQSINTLVLTGTVDGCAYLAEREETVSTARSAAVLTAEVTSVSPR